MFSLYWTKLGYFIPVLSPSTEDSFQILWSFSYRLIFDEKGISLSTGLRDVGVSLGAVLKLGINRIYEDVWEKELRDMWDGTKMYEMGGAMRRDAELRQRIRDRGSLTSGRLEQLADACFAHV